MLLTMMYQIQTILNFTNLVQSPEKLKLLLIITVVDILAVGPGIWNSWKAALMRDLYKYSEEVLYGADAYQLMELSISDEAPEVTLS